MAALLVVSDYLTDYTFCSFSLYFHQSLTIPEGKHWDVILDTFLSNNTNLKFKSSFPLILKAMLHLFYLASLPFRHTFYFAFPLTHTHWVSWNWFFLQLYQYLSFWPIMIILASFIHLLLLHSSVSLLFSTVTLQWINIQILGQWGLFFTVYKATLFLSKYLVYCVIIPAYSIQFKISINSVVPMPYILWIYFVSIFHSSVFENMHINYVDQEGNKTLLSY